MDIEDLISHHFICVDCLHSYHDKCNGIKECKYCKERCQCIVCLRINFIFSPFPQPQK